jgi:UDP-N-acetyl-D-glucosamine/UDP-N-acetyl-D-galactosamine dehydrogenase
MIQKVVAGQDARTLDIVAAVYGSVVTAGVHRAPSIKIAEAAKVIENTQRDLNIALMNELSLIFHELGIDTSDVLAAAATKWNFVPFLPGLVGGHCIGVDPYYLTHRAEMSGYHPQLILAGRRVNDGMGAYIARQCVRMMLRRNGATGSVIVLGLAFKENVPDIRNSKAIDVIHELESFGISPQIHDGTALAEEADRQYGIQLVPRDALKPADAVVLAVAHDIFVQGGWTFIKTLLRNETGIVLDVKAKLPRDKKPDGIEL